MTVIYVGDNLIILGLDYDVKASRNRRARVIDTRQ